MTIHFVNLVSWRHFTSYPNESRILNVDSISLKLLLLIFGRNVDRKSGPIYFERDIRALIRRAQVMFLTSTQEFCYENYQLPIWKNINEIEVNAVLSKVIEPFDEIVIGISSPKQDRLAELIQQIYPEKKIYCLGAAIYLSESVASYDSTGFTWFYFARKDWRRFLLKVGISIKELLRILFVKKEREKFRTFMRLL